MSDNYWNYATQSDSIAPIGGGFWKGDYPIKMKNYYNIKFGDGPFPTDYVYQKIEPKTPIVTIPINAANYANNSIWNETEGMITSVGTNGRSSFYGTYDQAGNVSEWVYNNQYLLRGGHARSRGPRLISKLVRQIGGSIIDSQGRSTNANFSLSNVGFRVSSKDNPYVFPNFVSITNISNTPDYSPVFPNGIGSVNYTYNIGKFTVTNIEYLEFLESVACREDKYNVYNDLLSSHPFCGIIQRKGNGYIQYSIKPFYRNKPVVNIDWHQAARFCNWLHNGKPSGPQDENTTEDGAYTLFGNYKGQSLIIEDVGNTKLSIDSDTKYLLINNNITILWKNGAPINSLNPDWDFLAAENIDGTNQLLLRYKNNGYLHLSLCDSSWRVLEGFGWWDPENNNVFNNKRFSDIENDFGIVATYPPTPFVAANTNARYYIPTENEWYKAAYYDHSEKKYWRFSTMSDIRPTAIPATFTGEGPFLTSYSSEYNGKLPYPLKPESPTIIPSANYNNSAVWDNRINLTTVGTNGGPSAYGTYDQSGNVPELVYGRLDNSSFIPRRIGVIRGGGYRSIITEGIINPVSRKNAEIYALKNAFGGFRLVTYSDFNIDTNKFVQVGNPNNQGDFQPNMPSGITHPNTRGYGSVNYIYYIGKYPVTVCEYLDFLNAIGKDNTNNIYDTRMFGACRIRRIGLLGSYTYELVNNDYSNKPIDFVSYFSAARYCNWLYNGKPTTGKETNDTTETGVYIISRSDISINPNMTFGEEAYYIPSENEWYKAAYYDPANSEPDFGIYFEYANQSNDIPTPVFALENGNGSLDQQNPIRIPDFTCGTGN